MLWFKVIMVLTLLGAIFSFVAGIGSMRRKDASTTGAGNRFMMLRVGFSILLLIEILVYLFVLPRL